MQSLRSLQPITNTFIRSATVAPRFCLTRTHSRKMTTDSKELGIENTNIRTADGVTLSDTQKTIVGCVLDLFAGRPSKQKLQLWKDDGVFEDPIAYAKGRQEYEAQWYGLEKAFSEIERVHHLVTSSGNPITMDMKTRYVIKGINSEKTIESQINIYTDGDKISHVQDKWNGSLPEGSFKDVSSIWTLFNPFWWLHYFQAWLFWAWSFTWYTRIWMAFRRLNASSMPKVVSVPEN